TPGTPVTATPLALVATAGTPSAKATTLAAVRAHGLATTLTCNEACAARGELLVTAAQAKRLGLLAKRSKAKAPVVLGTGQATRTAAGAFVLTIKLSAKARRALKHARTLRLTQTITVTGGAGKPVVRTRAVTLKAS
ncbi:MAG: hypothetical protein JWQ18_3676, partial [Conexibacter sp.]|nr:hypothetical protein [Conexibacter sp.]